MRRLSKVNIEWSTDFAYAVGLLTADGNLSPDGRHLNLTSKDREMVTNFKNCLKLENKIGRKSRGGNMEEKRYYVLQFGDKNFYDFLLDVGLMPNKSNRLLQLKIPDDYFGDFLRGYFDGDGSVSAHKHPESRHLQLRVRFASGSVSFLGWLKKKIESNSVVQGGWIMRSRGAYQLSYGKEDSIKLLKFMYNGNGSCSLTRKRSRAQLLLNLLGG